MNSIMDQTEIDELIEGAKNLNPGVIPAKHIMTRNPICIDSKTTIGSAIETLKIHRISGLPVTNGDRLLKGVITEYDLLIQAGKHGPNHPITFKTKVMKIDESATLKDILILLYKHRIKRLPVVDDRNHLLGIVSRIDVLTKFLPKK